jgi:hypothetical protein
MTESLEVCKGCWSLNEQLKLTQCSLGRLHSNFIFNIANFNLSDLVTSSMFCFSYFVLWFFTWVRQTLWHCRKIRNLSSDMVSMTFFKVTNLRVSPQMDTTNNLDHYHWRLLQMLHWWWSLLLLSWDMRSILKKTVSYRSLNFLKVCSI